MSITSDQLCKLREGDIVRITGWQGLTVEGPVSADTSGSLWLGQYIRLTHNMGFPTNWARSANASLVLVAEAPKPLYVNHDRTEPAMGDVVVDVDNGGADWTWHRIGPDWLRADGADFEMAELPDRLRLLVDGETGQAVTA